MEAAITGMSLSTTLIVSGVIILIGVCVSVIITKMRNKDKNKDNNQK